MHEWACPAPYRWTSSGTNRDNPAGRAYTGISSLTLQPASMHACMCVCARMPRMSERSFSICVMHLALKRVVICKSPLPRASGVKLGKADRKEGGRDRKTETDTGSMWMTGMSVKEGGQRVWEWFLLHNWLLSRVEQLWRTYMTAHHVWSRIHLSMINVP